MANDELRPEVIRRIVTLPAVRGDRMDAVLDANPAELAAAARELHQRSVELLQEAGALPRVGTVFDLDLRTAMALAGVYGTVERTWRTPGYTHLKLGDVLKVVGEREARWTVEILAWAGLAEYQRGPDTPESAG